MPAVVMAPGNKFPGDVRVMLYGHNFRLVEVARALRAFVLNEERRKERDATCEHWREDPRTYLMDFINDAVSARDDRAFVEVCIRYHLIDPEVAEQVGLTLPSESA